MDGTGWTGSAWRWEVLGKLGSGGGGGMMDELDLDVAWRRVGKAEVRARCAGSGAARRASGHLQEQDFSWKSTG